MTVPRLLRVLAIVIALVAAIDPAIVSIRSLRPDIAVITTDPAANRTLVDRVTKLLAKTFTVIPAPFASAAATVLVGTSLPHAVDELAAPLFAIIPDRNGPTVTLEAVSAPPSAPLESRVLISAAARVTGAAGRTLEVTLRQGGLIIDRATRRLTTNDAEAQRLGLTFVPTATGAVPLRVTAQILGTPRLVEADLVLDVRDRRWSVLFFDPRPSWMSTFVRRAIERDPRFAVTSRIVTSRNISTDAGQPPGALDVLAPVAPFDVVVVGAPEALSDRDVAGLDAFLRRRGGTLVLLFDQRLSGPYERLTQVTQWQATTSSVAVSIDPVGAATGGLRATEIAWPTRLPAGAEPIAWSAPAGATAAVRETDASLRRPIVWQSAVGAGRLVVSGALDAWEYRDSTRSGFDAFWQSLIAESGDRAPPPVAIRLSRALVAPAEVAEVTVTLRDAALAEVVDGLSVRASISATLVSPEGREAIRLWPDGSIGEFRGSVRAPGTAGSSQVVVATSGAEADAPMVVAVGAERADPDERDLVATRGRASGGMSLPESQLETLPATIAGRLRPTVRAVTWHPMRSAWWIVPFTLALAGEWWWRRRRGLA